MNKQPNILIVVVDSLRADHVSCYGYERTTTPNIDRLASEGCLFETAITAAPFSPASYASMFSNLYPHQHGVNGDTVRIWPSHFRRLAEKMKEAGYQTFGVSNNDFVGSQCNSIQGFDDYIDGWASGWCMRQHRRLLRNVNRFFGSRAARTLEFNRAQCAGKGSSEQSLDVVRRRISHCSRPFFGFAVLMDPHSPYDRGHRRFLPASKAASRFFRSVNESKMWVRCMAARRGPSADDLRIAVDCYDSETHHADQCIGRLLDWMRAQDVLDDTIVVIASDHGEGFGEHGVWGHGFSLHDALTRVPLLVRCPRYWKPGRRSGALVQLHDIHELCLSVAGNGEPDPKTHPNCLTQADDERWAGRAFVFSEFPQQTGTMEMFRKLNPEFVAGNWEHAMWSVRSHDWRYVEYDGGACELYDLNADPAELTSVAPDRPDILREYRARLAEHKADGRLAVDEEEPSEEVDAVVLDRLRALGYVE